MNEIATDLRNNVGAEIYCIDCNDASYKYAEYGLKNIISSGDSYYSKGNTEGEIKSIFERIASNFESTTIDSATLTSTRDLTLTNVSGIKKIMVGSSEYPVTNIGGNNYSLNGRTFTAEEDNTATINLNHFEEVFHQPGNIAIIY